MTRDQVLLVRESKYVKEQHPFHIVDQSLWPLCVSGALLYLTNGTVLCLHNYLRGPILLQLGLFLLLFSMFFGILKWLEFSLDKLVKYRFQIDFLLS